MASINEILLRIAGDTDDAERELNDLASDLEGFDRQEAEATLDLSDRQVRRKLAEAERQLNEFARTTASAEAEVDTASARSQLVVLQEQLASIDRSRVDAHVDAEITKALTQVQSLEARLEALESDEVEIDIDVRRGLVDRIQGLSRSVGRLSRAAQSATTFGERLSGAFTGFGARLGPISGSLGKLSTVLAALIPIIFGLVAALGALIGSLGAALAGAGALAVALAGTLGPAIGLAVGAVNRFEETVDTAGSAAHALQGAAEGLVETLYEATATGADRVFRGIAAALESLTPVVRALEPAFTRLGGAVGRALRGLGQMFSAPGWRRFFATMTNSLAALTPLFARSFGAFATILRDIAVAAMPFLIEGFRELSGFLSEVASNTDLQSLREDIGGLVDHLGSWLNLIGSIGNLMVSLFGGETARVGRQLVDSIARGADELAEWASSAEGQEEIKQFFEDALPIVGEFLRLLGNLIRTGVRLTDAMAPWIFLLLRGLNLALDAIVDLAGWLSDLSFDDVKEAARDAFAALPGIAASAGRALLEEAGELLEDLVDEIENFGSDALDAGEGLFESVADGIANAARDVWRAARDIVSDAIGRVTAAFSWARNAGRTLFRRVRQGIGDAWRAVVGAARSVVEGAVNKVSDAWNDARSKGETLARRVGQGIWNLVDDVRGTAREFVANAVNKVSDAWNDARSKGETLARRVGQGMWNLVETVKDTAGSIAHGAATRVGSFATNFFNAGKGLIQSFINGIGSLAGAVKDKVSDVLGGAADLLTGSEPKDPSSPLRGLADRGQALVDNLVAGVSAAGPRLSDALSRNLEAAVRVPQLTAPGPAGGGQTSNTYNLQVAPPSGGPADPEAAIALLDSKLRARGGIG